jgi:hypothetical protein
MIAASIKNNAIIEVSGLTKAPAMGSLTSVASNMNGILALGEETVPD